MGREGGLSVSVGGLAALPPAARRPRLYERAVRSAFAASKSKARGEVSVVFVGRRAMRLMNRRYLGHDYDTDVITFQHEAPPGPPAAGLPLGDIVISAWMARLQARELGHSVLAEAATLAAHGALHLLGHDDGAPRARRRMFALQDRIVASLRV